MSNSGVSEFLDRLNAAIEADIPIAHLEPAARIAVIDRYDRIAQKVYLHQLRLVQAMEDSNAADQLGASSLSALLQERLGLSPTEANAQIRDARALRERRSGTGAIAHPTGPGQSIPE